MSSQAVTILCAGPGLGFYIPGAVLARRLLRAGAADVSIVVLESLLPAQKQEIVIAARKAFHDDFRVALMGQRMAKDYSGELDAGRVNALLQTWQLQGRRRFVVFSEFWAPLLSRYLRECAADKSAPPIDVDYCHVDAAASTSWGLVRERPPGVRDVWFVRWEDRRQHYFLDISGEAPLPFSARDGGLLTHGGGWGMGTYREKIPRLEAAGLRLDVLCYDPRELAERVTGIRYFLLDPSWFPWARRENESLFPPLGKVRRSGEVDYVHSVDYPALFRRIRRAPAMISKPGGGTLIDSFAAATPLLLLEPFGEYERKNGELWRELGFALYLDEWIADGCRNEALEELHRNLLAARPRIPDYAEHLATSLREDAEAISRAPRANVERAAS